MKLLKTTAHRVANAAGFEFSRQGAGGRLRCQRRGADYIDIVKRTIGSPRNALVLGAFQGAGVMHIRRAFPACEIHAFEPDPQTFEVLRQAMPDDIELVPMALGAQPGKLELYRNTSSDTNSLLPSAGDMAELRTQGRVEVAVTTLDEYCAHRGLEEVDYVHADLQGYELHMLRGATELLRRRAINLVLLEVCFESLYSGQADFAELWREITCYGYRFVAMQGLYYPPGSAIARSGNVVFAA